jgi:pectate lyase
MYHRNVSIHYVIFLFITSILKAQEPDSDQVVGFASIDGEGNQMFIGGTTGGKGGEVVKATNTVELINYISRENPLIIQVEGTIELPINRIEAGVATLYGAHFISSHKTIIGVGQKPTIKGGGFVIGNIPFDNDVTTPPVNAPHNIIIRNIHFDGTGSYSGETDCISIFMHAHHIWVDHCTFRNEGDGALDTKRGSNYITVSWCHFIENVQTSIVGLDHFNASQESGYLNLTYHHNYWQDIVEWGPRVYFGKVHVFNNYYEGTKNFALGLGRDAEIYSENNVMEGGNSFSMDISGGKFVDKGSRANCDITPTGDVNWTPDQYYKYSIVNTDSVKSIVTKFAGAGKITGIINPKKTLSISSILEMGKGKNAIMYNIRGIRIPALLDNRVSQGIYIIKSTDNIYYSTMLFHEDNIH